jgi:hypothetical protein
MSDASTKPTTLNGALAILPIFAKVFYPALDEPQLNLLIRKITEADDWQKSISTFKDFGKELAKARLYCETHKLVAPPIL